MPKKHTMPPFLEGTITADAYERWLLRKARAHVKRDRGRGHKCTGAQYREAIHAAVILSEGKDAYTGRNSIGPCSASTTMRNRSRAVMDTRRGSRSCRPWIM